MSPWGSAAPAAGPGAAFAHGALVGAIGPDGSREVSGRVGPLVGPRAVAQGAAVPLVGGTACDVAHGALVPGPETWGASVCRGCGADEVWTVDGWGMAFGSRSQLNKEPKGKCCTTGNLDSTSALYILIMPCRQLVYDVTTPSVPQIPC